MSTPNGDAPRKRGRPPKPKSDAPKRPVGRPPKPKEPEGENRYAAVDELLRRPIGRSEATVFTPDQIRQVGELARICATQPEIASVMGVSLKTLQNIFNRQPEVRAAWEDGMNFARVSLRRNQFILSEKNHPAAIFLGKNLLGQKDVQNIDATITRPANELSETELEEIARRTETPAKHTSH